MNAVGSQPVDDRLLMNKQNVSELPYTTYDYQPLQHAARCPHVKDHSAVNGAALMRPFARSCTSIMSAWKPAKQLTANKKGSANEEKLIISKIIASLWYSATALTRGPRPTLRRVPPQRSVGWVINLMECALFNCTTASHADYYIRGHFNPR